MRDKLIQARASVLNEVSSKKGGSIFILASVDEDGPEYDPEQQTEAHVCSACKTGFSTQASLAEPFCPNCGSGETNPVTDDVMGEQLPQDDAELSFAKCPNCETSNVIHDVTAKLLDGHIHCVTCGTEVSYEMEWSAEGSEPLAITDADPADVKDAVENTKESQVNADMNQVVVPTATDADPISDAAPEAVKTEMEGDALKPIPSVDAVKPAPAPSAEGEAGLKIDTASELDEDVKVEDLTDDDLSPQDQEASPACAEQEDSAGGIDNFGDKKAEPFTAAVDLTLLSTLSAFKGKKELTLCSVREDLLAFVNEVHVATLASETAGESTKVMHTPAFAKAIMHTAKEHGIKKALAHYGFGLVTIKFPQQAVISKLLGRQSKAEAAKYDQERSELSNTFMQCMSVASAGLNKGFFSKEENALKRGFYDTLTAANVKNAEKLIDKVFSQFGDQYHKTLLTIAQDLMSKPIEVRNSMAETVGATSYLATATEDDQEGDQETDEGDEDSTASLESRMESASITPIRYKGSKEVASPSIRGLRAETGGSFFKRS
jgi:predicted RNA-binding Zn-ribbon protein involved in translation (DUF1610 family)